MNGYDEARAIIAANTRLSGFAGPRSEQLVRAAEAALSLTFPASYRQFLLDFGAGNFGAAEIFGVIDEDFESSSVPDGIWYTLQERKTANLPRELVVIGNTGMGELYVLDTSSNEGPIFLIDSGGDLAVRELAAPSFGTFFLREIQAQLR